MTKKATSKDEGVKAEVDVTPGPTAEQVKAEKEFKEVSEKIEALLQESGYGLQPFLQFSEFGVIPNVRLVKAPKEDGKDK